jgi:ABC-type Fe3+-siderophore transport system permease subunit
MKLAILAGILLCVLGLAIATGYTNPGAKRRTLARAGATAFFAFLASFFWLSPFTARGGFLTGMSVFFAIGGTISAWKLVAGLSAGAAGEKSATH